MNKLEPVSNIMTNHVYSINQRARLQDAITIFKKHRIHHLPVTKNDVIVGMLSSTDIDRLTFGDLFDNEENIDETMLNMLSIAQIMTTNVVTIEIGTPIKHVAELFAKNGYHALPIVKGSNLQGIVTTTDVIKYMLKQY